MSGLVRAERLFRARRRSVRRRRVRPVVAVAVATTLAGAAVWTVDGSPWLRLDRVQVVGISRLTTAQVLAAARPPVGAPLVSVPTAALAARVRALAPVAQVRVRRSWPDTVVVQVVERRPVAWLATTAGAELLDPSGVPFATVPAPPPGLVEVTVGGPVPGAGAAAATAVVAVWDQLPAWLRARVRSAAADTPDAVTLRLTDGATVGWGSATEPAAKLAVLRTLLAVRAHSYDVSTPTVAVTR